MKDLTRTIAEVLLARQGLSFYEAPLEGCPVQVGYEATQDALVEADEIIAAISRAEGALAETFLMARRWEALNAALPRMMGSAGFEVPEGGSWHDAKGMRPDAVYLHAGIEFWTGGTAGYHGEERTAGGRRHLELIADQIIAQGGKALLFEER